MENQNNAEEQSSPSPSVLQGNVIFGNMEEVEVLIKQEVCGEIKCEVQDQPMDTSDSDYNISAEIIPDLPPTAHTHKTCNKAIQVSLLSHESQRSKEGNNKQSSQRRNKNTSHHGTDAMQFCQASLVNSDDETIFNINIECDSQANFHMPRRSQRQSQIVSTKEIALEYVCRLCEQKSYTKLVKIFGTQGKQLKLADQIHFHLPIKVKENDGLPLGICLSCVDALKVCEEMYHKSLSTDSHLRKFFQIQDPNLTLNVDVAQNSSQTDKKKSAKVSATAKQKDTKEHSAIDTGTSSQDASITDNKEADPQVSLDIDCTSDNENSDSGSDNDGAEDENVDDDEDEEEDEEEDEDEDDEDDEDDDDEDDDDDDNDSDDSNQNEENKPKRIIHLLCYICQKLIPGKAALLEHKKTHSGDEAGMKCRVCEETLPDDESYIRHHNLHGGYPCMTCGRNLKNKMGLQKHIERHNNPPVFCEVCGKTIASIYKLKYHMQTHTDERPFACSKCDLKFKTKATLLQHSAIHSVKPTHICDICGLAYHRASHLKMHLELHKKGSIVPYQLFCDMCDLKFKHEHHLFKHKMAAHDLQPTDEDKKKYYWLFKEPSSASSNGNSTLCPVCGKGFLTKLSLKQHLKSHGSNERKMAYKKMFECEFCGKNLASKRAYEIHKRGHTGERPFKCHLCGESLRSKQDLTYHINKHQGVKPYKCQQCGKCFQRVTTLYQHRRIHLAEKKYECNSCPYKTHRRAALRVHLRVHTDERPYVCKECGKSYKYSTDLSGHMSVHTGIITQRRMRPKLKKKNDAEENPAVSEVPSYVLTHL